MPNLANRINANPFSFILKDWNVFGGNFGEIMLATKADETGVVCRTRTGQIRFYVWGQLFTIKERQ